MWYGQLTDLRKRLGEMQLRHATGLWVRGFADTARLEGFADTTFTQTTYGASLAMMRRFLRAAIPFWLLVSSSAAPSRVRT